MTNSSTHRPKFENITGEISVRLDVSGGRVVGVDIRDSRPTNVAWVFVGRKPQDVAGMMGTMFSLCSRAQTIACLAAMEQALGLSVTLAQTAARDLLRLAEMIAQTALRLCMDWPQLLGLDTRPELVRTLLAAEIVLEKALFGGGEWKVPGGVEMEPDMAAARLIVQDIARKVNNIVGELGDQLRTALSEQCLGAFGVVENADQYEDGAVKRQWDNPAVQEVRERFGVGLATRLEARLADLRLLVGEMDLRQVFPLPSGDRVGNAQRWSGEGATGNPYPPHPTSTNDPASPGRVFVSLSPEGRGKKSTGRLAAGHGNSQIETARGALHHRISIQNNLITDYQITAPTDANFLPGGPVSTGLIGALATDNLARAAELHVLAVDPCVEVEVRISHA
jgi:coenzyme F420-reducing hydrogenase alpha subunit